MVTTHDISTKVRMKHFESVLSLQLDDAFIKRKDFFDKKINDIANEYRMKFLRSGPILLKYEGGLDGRVLFDAIVKEGGRLIKPELASFIVVSHKPHNSYSLEATVYNRNFQKYATIIAEEYEKKFDDKTMIFLNFKD